MTIPSILLSPDLEKVYWSRQNPTSKTHLTGDRKRTVCGYGFTETDAVFNEEYRRLCFNCKGISQRMAYFDLTAKQARALGTALDVIPHPMGGLHLAQKAQIQVLINELPALLPRLFEKLQAALVEDQKIAAQLEEKHGLSTD